VTFEHGELSAQLALLGLALVVRKLKRS